MQKLNFLNKKEIKKILSIAKKQWGCVVDLNYVFLQNEKNKIYIINKDIEKIDTIKLRVNSIGLYFGELRDDELRLSIEGSQLIGECAKKNVLELNKEQLKEWMAGNDLFIEGDFSGYIIIKCGKDFLGCGKVREGKVFNYINKVRRVNIID